MKYKLLGRKGIYGDKFLTIERARLRVDKFAGGKLEIERYGLVRPRVVAILVYIRDKKKLVLVEQFRYSTVGTGSGWIWEVVAGVIDKGEEAEAAARREVWEEAGYGVEKLVLAYKYYTSPGFSDQYTYFYVAETVAGLKESKGGGVIAEGEDIRVHEVTLVEAYELLNSGKLCDAMTILGLQYFFLDYLPLLMRREGDDAL